MAIPSSDKVDLFLDVNLGVFGQVIPQKTFEGAAMEGEAKKAISIILKEFSFPVLNVIYSASGRLFVKDQYHLKVGTRLEELEVRVKIEADPADVLLLGIHPMDITVSKPDEPSVQVQPKFPELLTGLTTLIPAIAPFAGLLSGLGLIFGPLIRPKFHILDKTLLSKSDQSPAEFGWYHKAHKEIQQEGPHLGMAFLGVRKNIASLRVTATLLTDWEEGKVENQETLFDDTLAIVHPEAPKTPDLYDLTDVTQLPVTLSRDVVEKLLGVTATELDDLIKDGRVVAFGSGDKQRITKGSIISALGLDKLIGGSEAAAAGAAA